jgi:deoxyribodipyrimidine photolyase
VHGLAAAEKEYLAHQIAALRISLAKRDADVARLEGESVCALPKLVCSQNCKQVLEY